MGGKPSNAQEAPLITQQPGKLPTEVGLATIVRLRSGASAERVRLKARLFRV